jgi:hypothetical protein
MGNNSSGSSGIGPDVIGVIAVSLLIAWITGDALFLVFVAAALAIGLWVADIIE